VLVRRGPQEIVGHSSRSPEPASGLHMDTVFVAFIVHLKMDWNIIGIIIPLDRPRLTGTDFALVGVRGVIMGLVLTSDARNNNTLLLI
jgi:hypothetical protein